MSSPASPNRATLKAITKSDQPPGLTLEWSDGVKGSLPFALLRRECPCALCKGERVPFEPPSPTQLPSFKSLPPYAEDARDLFKVGNYALGIRWGDGHDTGIYSFEYLRRLVEAKSL